MRLFCKGYVADVVYNQETKEYRGEFIFNRGGAEFYATSLEDILVQGMKTLDYYLAVCRQQGIPVIQERASQ